VLYYLKLVLNASHQHTIEEGHYSVGHNTSHLRVGMFSILTMHVH